MGLGVALPLMLLAIPGTALVVSAKLLFGGSIEARTSVSRLVMSLAGWILIWMAITGAILALLGPSPMAAAVMFMLGVVDLMVWVRIRTSEHRALMATVAAGMQRGIPVSESARAMADETGGRTGARALRLAAAVESGLPLDYAVTKAWLWLSTGLKVAVRMGCAVGQPGDALQRELAVSSHLEDTIRPLAPRILYLLSLITVGTGILTFMMWKIVPVFDKMFQEFELPLPAPTIQLVNMSRFALDQGILLFFLELLLWHVFGAAVLMYIGVLPRDLPLPRWVYRRSGRRLSALALLLSPLRFFNWLFRRYDGSIVLRALAWAVERGVPLPAALKLVGNVYPLAGIRWQVLGAAERIEQGVAWTDTLREARLIGAADVAVLKAAERAGNLPWAMNEVADSLLRREVYRWQWWYNIVSPLAIVLFGVTVGFISIALFLPLIALIEGIAR